MNKRTSLYLNPPIAAAIDGVESISGRIGAICDRYAEITRRAKITQIFDTAELNAFSDCCKSAVFSPAIYLSGAVLELMGGLSEKWGLNATITINKLSALTYVEQVALVEYIESSFRKLAVQK